MERLEEIETKQLVLFELLTRIADELGVTHPENGYDFHNASGDWAGLYSNAANNRIQ